MTLLRTRLVGGAMAAAMMLAAAGCGSSAGMTPSSTVSASQSTLPSSPTAAPSPTRPSAAPDDDAFALSMADPIDSWRTSYLTSSMTFAVPGTVVATSRGDGSVDLVANGDAVLDSRPMAVDDAFHIGS